VEEEAPEKGWKGKRLRADFVSLQGVISISINILIIMMTQQFLALDYGFMQMSSRFEEEEEVFFRKKRRKETSKRTSSSSSSDGWM
jgi:hypothetical protein